jgi:hypothetical protein
MSEQVPPSVPRDRIDVVRTVVFVAAGLWVAAAVVYQLRAAAAVQDGGVPAVLTWFAAIQAIGLVAFVASLGIYVVLWLEERRGG